MANTKGTYTVLARRYRPQTFQDVVGQQHVAQALKNAILADRVAHAYLFTGARGVGKTSMARILAKALNCLQAENGEPCNQCEMCHAISTGSDVDVMEIDGASNRGIDDIRALRANVGIRSMRTRIKMYIIDEVHMLTKEAFNALLKTLEEPPANVKFVFCTTEPQKVPDTILSRCQRFDFSSIETQAISERLAEIATQEGVEVTNEAIDLVARRAGGSMRDSQSLFDQLLAFGGEKIEAKDVNQLLGTADDDRLISLIEAIKRQDRGKVLSEIDDAIHAGVQLGNLLDQLVNVYRDLMIVQCGAESVELLGVGGDQRPRLTELAHSIGLQTITSAMQILSETKSRLMRVPHARALIDLAVIRLASLEDLQSVSQLITELKSRPPGAVTIGTPTQSSRPTQQAPQKKTPEITSDETQPHYVEASQSQPVVSQEVIPQSESPNRPTIEFSEATREEIWKELLTRIEGSLGSYLRQAIRTEVSSADRLTVIFSEKHKFSFDSLLQKPENQRLVEDCLSGIAGQRIHVKFNLEASKPQVSGSSGQAPMHPTAAAKHEFVKQAESIFSATIGRTDRIRKN
ncbi:DNA polymerase III subunit gamma/tau [Rubinisphaera italica]|uniref:DNA polymerase III subunit gamma/tau n=1 Tax=Rubinisphaera italica TaxID=2527969 RepID=A0A5C5XGG6_9PLAN|nr:DNA polymerase III subunit gamma/tau [Rubinisphaera italica]TWT61779.1 DNA polymerase III subunit tau [Rubinisphaera italica]